MPQWIYGKNTVRSALESNKGIESLMLVNQDLKFIALANRNHIPIEYISAKQANKLSNNGNHQGVLARMKDYAYVSLDSLIQNNKDNPYSTLVLCDGIEDPHNLGAILRVCDACGFNGVIIKQDRNVGLNATVAKVSVGAIESVPVACVNSMNTCIQTLKDNGYWIVTTTLDSESVDYRAVNYDTKIVLVLGNEGKGVSSLVAKRSDWKVILPMHGIVDSLNVSCAFAAMGYEILNQRFPYRGKASCKTTLK